MDKLKILPRPTRDEDLYSSILQKGYKTYPQRLGNSEKATTPPSKAILDYQPIILDIENVSRCNYRCIMCQMSTWRGNKRAADMTFGDFTELLDSQQGLTEIKLQGIGEPLLGGDLYFEMIRYARSKHLWVRSTTNASLLHQNENYRKLIDSDICEIQISIDGATAKTYEKIRPGGTFKLISENCIRLHAHCREVDRRRTRMWTVVQKDNFSELEELPALAARLGFKRLTLALDLSDFGQTDLKKHNDIIAMHGKLTHNRAVKVIELGKKESVEVTFWIIDEKFNTSSPNKLCPWPFQRAYISSDMRVVPCCMMANPEVMDLGDARELNKVWNDQKMVKFRQMHLDGKIPRVCRSCYI
jgi:radical SAM protein with 4Fe4S-binding SPASM domain